MNQTTPWYTTLADLDPAEVGAALMTATITARQLGHASPCGSLPYMQPATAEQVFVIDVLTACLPGQSLAPHLAAASDEVADKIAQAVTR